jgi:hypothetical protein
LNFLFFLIFGIFLLFNFSSIFSISFHNST